MGLDEWLAVVGALVCVYVWIVRPILRAFGIDLREPKTLTRLRTRTAQAMNMSPKELPNQAPPVQPEAPEPTPAPVARIEVAPVDPGPAVVAALNNIAAAGPPRGPKPPPAGSSPWDAVFREWLAEQQDLNSSWYRKMEVPSGTVFVFVIPRAVATEAEEEVIDPTKTEKCPRGHAITEKARQGSYCSACADEGFKYPGQGRPGVFKATDFSTVKARRRYAASPVLEET